MTKKLEQAAREVIRQHSMECLSDKTVDALQEALAEQAEPVSPYKALPEEIWSKPFSSGAISVPVQQAEQEPVLMPVRRGSRITCVESGEKCVVWATSHTDCWVQFPDGQAGQYTYEQIGKYFSIEENQAADEAYERMEPVAWLWVSEHGSERLEWEPVEDTSKWKSTPLYAAPVRTKDLTDDEINEVLWHRGPFETVLDATRAVIAADREKNKCR